MRLPVFATILTLCAVAVLCGLGTWQVQRMHWKQGLLADLQAAYNTGTLPPLSFEDIGDIAAGGMNFARGTVQGRYRHELEIALGPRTWEGRPGYHILTPLELDRGGFVIVNRGWAPLDKKDPAGRPDSQPGGYVMATGLFRRPEAPNMFVPENDPAAGQWHSVDLAQIAAASKLDRVAPLVLYAEEESGQPALPVKEALRWQPPDNHLSYAIFWFGMAGILLVIFTLRFARKAG